MRLGIAHLVAQVAEAGRALLVVIGERDQARVERDAARREVADCSATVVACRYCGARAGSRCVAVEGSSVPQTAHTARLDAASRHRFRVGLGEAS